MVLPVAAQSVAPSATQIAAAADHHYNVLHRLRVNFTETYQGMGMDRHESGVLLLEKPGRMRWNYAEPAGKFDDELVPVSVKQKKGDPIVFAMDEGVRADATAESLGKLRPIEKDGVVTAGNA